MKFWVKTAVFLLACQPVMASISGDLTRAFTRAGASINVTNPNVYKGQEGTMAFGGNMYLRSDRRNFQPGYFQPTSFATDGCDMDIHLGGFEFVNGKKYIEMARAIGSSAGAYFFSLALKQIAPQIMNQMEALQAMANKFNQFNMNSCDAGMFFVDKGIDVMRKIGERSCRAQGIKQSTNEHGGAVTAREECRKPSVIEALTDEASKDPETKDTVEYNKNLAWYAIEKNPTLRALDNETKYLLMSLTGTIVISKKQGEAPQTPQTFFSKLENHAKLIDALSMKTSNAEGVANNELDLYTCNEEHELCLNVVPGKVNILESDTFYYQVRQMLQNIEKKVRKKEALSDAEKNFIHKNDLPIYKLIKLQTAYTRNIPISFLNEYVELISMELLFEYMEQCIGDVMQAFNDNLLAEDVSRKFIDMAIRAKQKVGELRINYSQRAAQRQEMMFRVESMQKTLTANLSGELFSKMNWSKNLRTQL